MQHSLQNALNLVRHFAGGRRERRRNVVNRSDCAEKVHIMRIGESLGDATLELGNQSVIKAVYINDNNGQVVVAELFERQNFQKLLKCAETAAQGNKGVAFAFHELLALVHCCSLYALRAVLEINPGKVELFGNYADNLSADGMRTARRRAHKPGSARTEYDSVAVRCKALPELFGKVDITLGDVAA